MKKFSFLTLAYPSYFLLILGQYFLSEGMNTAFSSGNEDAAYQESIEKWHEERITALKAEDGWLNLAGLYWLKTGENTFGNDPRNDLVFPPGKIPSFAGKFILSNGEVLAQIQPNVDVQHENQRVNQLEIFSKNEQSPLMLAHNSLRWFVIKRGEKYGIRLRDLSSAQVKAFKGIERFPVNTQWKLEARLDTSTRNRLMPITDILGMTSQQPLAGTLVFSIHGKTYRLDATVSGKKLFVMFADPTNEEETYGSGRFLYADLPGTDGTTTLDFNKAINPPCAFTAFATCPLPPRQNRLDILVRAGEKNYGNH